MLESEALTIEDLLETRLLLEVPLAGLAAQRAGDAEIEQLDALIREAGQTLPEVDASVHRSVARIARNSLAAAFTDWIVEVLLAPLHELVAPAAVEEVIVEQHRDLLRAIRRGDPAAAERAMREHLTYLRDLVDLVREWGV
jgi:GntR family transcriptional repressor for pyruvate dehydrogenase complex